MEENLQTLLQACKAGNEEKWNLLFAKYHPIARRYIKNRLRTLDEQTQNIIAQDVMLALHSKIQSINNIEHLVAFIRTVARNKCVDYIRKNKLTTQPISDELPLIEEKTLLTEAKKDLIHKALANLNEQTAELLRMRYLENMSYKEIAASAGIDEAQVGMKLSRALVCLKRELAKFGMDSPTSDIEP